MDKSTFAALRRDREAEGDMMETSLSSHVVTECSRFVSAGIHE
jgi:hypothetical protein